MAAVEGCVLVTIDPERGAYEGRLRTTTVPVVSTTRFKGWKISCIL